jgi:hypothetical protein
VSNPSAVHNSVGSFQLKLARLRRKMCSEYWARFVAHGGSPSPRTRCKCLSCHQLQVRWPSVYVGSVGLSYECYLDLVVSRQRRSTGRIQSLTEDEARAAGLALVRSRKRPKPALVGACQRCGQPRPKGRRFCSACERKTLAEMEKQGYFD